LITSASSFIIPKQKRGIGVPPCLEAGIADADAALQHVEYAL
jgi:hypothetical protein